MKNVIDLTSRLKKSSKAIKGAGKKATAPVIDMTEARNEMLSQERRKVKRTILTEFIGACALVQGKGLLKVALHDISETGLGFDVQEGSGHFMIGEEIAMRVYLNQQTYFGFLVTVQNIRAVEGENSFRHGVNFVKGSVNDSALHHLVKFIETVSASLESDSGDIMVSNLSR